MPGKVSLLPENIVPADTPRTVITRGSNRSVKTARPSGTSDFSSTASRRCLPTFKVSSGGVSLSRAILELAGFATETSIGFGKLVSTALAAPLSPVLTAATSVAAWLLISDLGAGTKGGGSSIVRGIDTGVF